MSAKDTEKSDPALYCKSLVVGGGHNPVFSCSGPKDVPGTVGAQRWVEH